MPESEIEVDSHAKARILAAALPDMQRYSGKTVVIKYGGHAMGDATLALDFARDVVLLKQAGVRPVIVHGGGPQIGQMLKRLNIQSEFSAGLRITDKATVEIVEMVLAGAINKQIVAAINAVGGRGVGLCGKDGNMIIAKKLTHSVPATDSNIERIVDLGFVGEPETVNRDILDVVSKSDLIPIIAPVAASAEGETYNINADTCAGAIAGALNAERLLMLTDVAGVLDSDGSLIEELSADQARSMIKKEVIHGGMIPKVETCIDALDQGVGGVVILDGKVPHSVLLELFTKHGAGTLIRS